MVGIIVLYKKKGGGKKSCRVGGENFDGWRAGSRINHGSHVRLNHFLNRTRGNSEQDIG